MPNLLEQLAKMTVIVADTGDIEQIERFRPRDATTNPTLVLQAASLPQYESIIADSVRSAIATHSNRSEAMAVAARSLAIEFGRKILGLIVGRVSTEVDARASFDTEATVAQAKAIIEAYARAGISPKRVLVKIAATWEGIRAAERLEREGIHTNLTLLFGFHQAVACADAGVTLISPFVGRILDWHKKSTGRSDYASHEDPGVVSVTRIYNYYKRHGYKTEVMGASFRNMGEITELAGCDLLTISPALLSELEASSGTLVRKLEPEHARTLTLQREVFDAQRFAFAHSEDRMASDKLSEGIKGFSDAIVSLETKLGEYAGRSAR